MRRFFREGSLSSRRSRTTLRLPNCSTWIVWPGAYKDSHKKQSNCDMTQQERKGIKIARRLKWSEGQADRDLHLERTILTRSGYLLPRTSSNQWSNEYFHEITPFLTTVRSTRLYREECNPPYRRVNKVRGAYKTKSEYYLR